MDKKILKAHLAAEEEEEEEESELSQEKKNTEIYLENYVLHSYKAVIYRTENILKH